MKTRELIKLLQEEDPSGECHVRINSEPISSVYSLPGYWDGPYNYLEKDENGDPIWVQSTKGDKIDIGTVDLFWLAEYYKGDWEEMKKHIRVEYTYLDDKHTEHFLKLAEKECIEYNRIEDEIEKDFGDSLRKRRKKNS
jgi:hypothetical protein